MTPWDSSYLLSPVFTAVYQSPHQNVAVPSSTTQMYTQRNVSSCAPKVYKVVTAQLVTVTAAAATERETTQMFIAGGL